MSINPVRNLILFVVHKSLNRVASNGSEKSGIKWPKSSTLTVSPGRTLANRMQDCIQSSGGMAMTWQQCPKEHPYDDGMVRQQMLEPYSVP